LKEGNLVWSYKDRSFPYFSSPAVTQDRVIFGGRDRRIHCVDRATGEKIWTLAARGKVDSSPVVCGDKVVVGADDGRLYLIALADGKELWDFEIGQPITSSPAVASGRVVVGSEDGSVYAFGTK
jgi:eukaryotic-like serine/threonine-protein kinase